MVLYRSYDRVRDTPAAEPTPRRDFSRVTGHHNTIDDDSSLPSHFDFSLAPPSYRTATVRPSQLTFQTPSPPSDPIQPESLPQYECTVELEGAAGLKYEQSTPFDSLEDREWTDVYLKLHGTSLSIHCLGSVGKLSKALGSPKPDWPGRLIKRYTLQQAEAGLASDAPKHELVASTLAAALWPSSKIKRLQQESPHLFDHIRQYVIRLRLESEQLVLRFKTWEERAQWIDRLCKAIDIASPLDYRTEPKYHTLPRRRRQRANRNTAQAPISNMASLIEEQERIMRARFPHLLGNNTDDEAEAPNNELADVPEETTADPEAEDLDNTVVTGRSDNMQRLASRARPQQAYEFTDQTFFVNPTGFLHPSPNRSTASPPSSNDPNDKLVPAEIDPNQVLRWRRRCMPTLLYTSRRCDDIIFKDGKLWKIDWDSQSLKSYPEPPPGYEPPAEPQVFDNIITKVESNTDNSTSSTRVSESQSRALRPTPSTTTMNDSAESSLNTLDSNISPATSTTDTSNRSSKLWGEMKGWSKRMRKNNAASRGTHDTIEPEPSRPTSQHLMLHKAGHDDASDQTFSDDTLRVLGIH